MFQERLLSNVNCEDKIDGNMLFSNCVFQVGDVLTSSIGVMGSLKAGISDEELQTAKNKLKLEIVAQVKASNITTSLLYCKVENRFVF